MRNMGSCVVAPLFPSFPLLGRRRRHPARWERGFRILLRLRNVQGRFHRVCESAEGHRWCVRRGRPRRQRRLLVQRGIFSRFSCASENQHPAKNLHGEGRARSHRRSERFALLLIREPTVRTKMRRGSGPCCPSGRLGLSRLRSRRLERLRKV